MTKGKLTIGSAEYEHEVNDFEVFHGRLGERVSADK
jgi:hypothetical protein